ncbi:MAG: FAD:protein FMN transferase [Spirochaetes bacterium]|jgi:thiamine biosynthesis lipoprotein|nr:FAD:protein FMN transferase [Spirochaetota bacterium]
MKKVFFILLLTLVFACEKGKSSVHRVARPLLGTVVNLTLVCDEEKAAPASSAAFKEIARIEALMSPYINKSDVYRINSEAGHAPVRVDAETLSLVEFSGNISSETGGAFDITFASIAGLWDYRKKNFTPPAESAIKTMLPLVNYRNIIINNKESTVGFVKKGVKIGLGAIAKGYAVKRAVKVLEEMGIRSAIVEAGGDLQVVGDRNGEKWLTGLKNPRGGDILMAFYLEGRESVATSGDYERRADYHGKRYHHIIDPRTGKPTETFSSVSVISRDAVVSDAYATAFFVLGLEGTVGLLKKHPELMVILIGLDGSIYISRGLKDRIRPVHEIKPVWI